MPRPKQAQQVVLGAFMGKCNTVWGPKNAPRQTIAAGPVSPLAMDLFRLAVEFAKQTPERIAKA
jgi:hypothetical protein